VDKRTASILTVDVGTSSLKAVAYNSRGQVVDTATCRYGYRAEQPGWAEGEPDTWWRAMQDALAELRKRCDLGSTEAISFTGQMHSAVLLSEEGHVIPPTILWLDRRASTETRDLQDKLGLPPYQLNSTYTLPKLLWLHRHRPETLEKTRKILWPKDYLRFRLTGEVCTDLTEPGGAALLDWEERCWVKERLSLVGLAPDVLPPIRPASGDGGAILPAVARTLGLNPHVQVVVGMGDVAALFGAAPPAKGRVTCSLGSSSMVFAPFDETQAVVDPEARLYVYPFGPYPLLGGVSSTTGAALVWICELCEGQEFGQCVSDALAVAPGADGVSFIPHLAGERSPYWTDDIRGGFYGLQLAHTRAHLVRAVMEGVAYSLRHLLDIYTELGVPVGEIALAGGGATTEGWPQIIADVCRSDVLIYAEEETVTRVLYALCQVNLGRDTFEDALLQTFQEPQIVRCRERLADVYRERYQDYRAFAAFAAKRAATS
jgi:xylulokinase